MNYSRPATDNTMEVADKDLIDQRLTEEVTVT